MKQVSEQNVIDFLEGELGKGSRQNLYNFLMTMSRSKKLLDEFRDLKKALRSLDTAGELVKDVDPNRLHNKIMLEIRMGTQELGDFNQRMDLKNVNPIYKSKKKCTAKSVLK